MVREVWTAVIYALLTTLSHILLAGTILTGSLAVSYVLGAMGEVGISAAASRASITKGNPTP